MRWGLVFVLWLAPATALAEQPPEAPPTGTPADPATPTQPAVAPAPALLPIAEQLPRYVGAVMTVATAWARSLYFFSQMQLGVRSTLEDLQGPGGVGLHGAFNVLGYGMTASLRLELDDAQRETLPSRRGGLGSLAFEIRPLGMAQTPWHKLLDPHLAVGSEIGGTDDAFRASIFVAAGFDIGLIPWMEQHPALTIQYFLRPLQTPDDFALHGLHVGTAWRHVF